MRSRWKSRRRHNRRRRNPLYTDSKLLNDAKRLLDIIAEHASSVMGRDIDPLSDSILPEEDSLDATPVNIVAHAVTPPGHDRP